MLDGLYTDECSLPFSSFGTIVPVVCLLVNQVEPYTLASCLYLPVVVPISPRLPSFDKRFEMSDNTAWQSGRKARHTRDLLGQELPRSSL